MTRSRPVSRHIPAVALVVGLLTVSASPASASAWTAALAGGSKALASAGSLVAPTGLASACVSPTGTTIKLTWTAATLASSYTVLQATDSTGYTAVATGVTGTSWTSGALPDGFNYYYEVTSVKGNWSSAPSASTPRRYVAGGACS
jgi:hypothetical protein